MAKVTLELLAKICPEFAGWSEEAFDFRDAPLWSLVVEGDNELHTAKVTLARIDKPTHTSVPEDCVGDLSTMYGYSTDEGFTDCEEIDGAQYVYSNLASVLVVRALHVVMRDNFEGEVMTTVTLHPIAGSKRGLTFESLLPVSFDDPLTFGSDAVYTGLDVGASGVSDKQPADVVTDYAVLPPQVGDEARDPRLDNSHPMQGAPKVARTLPGVIMPDDPVHDALLGASGARVDWARAFASLLARDRGVGDVLIVGDRDGVLGCCLSEKGIDSIAVGAFDFTGEDIGISCMGRRRFIRGYLDVEADIASQLIALGIDGPLWAVVLTGDDPGGASFDHLQQTTDLGLAFGALQPDVPPDIFVRMTRPPICGVSGQIILLPGVDYSGGEVFARISPSCDDTDAVGRRRFCNFVVDTLGQVRVTFASHYPAHEVYRSYFRARGLEYDVALDQWPDFVSGIPFVLAAVDAKRGYFDKSVRSSRNCVELIARLGQGGDTNGGADSELIQLYESGKFVPVGVGTPLRALRRVSTMLEIISARYASLVSLCAFRWDEAPDPIVHAMGRASCGALLHPSVVGSGMVGAADLRLYSRVLDYRDMSILASLSLYRAVEMYVTGYRRFRGRRLEAWRLQHLLWGLSVMGTYSDKRRYITILLRSLLSGRPRAPSAPSQLDEASINYVGVIARQFDDDVALFGAIRDHRGYDRGPSLPEQPT